MNDKLQAKFALWVVIRLLHFVLALCKKQYDVAESLLKETHSELEKQIDEA